MSSVADQAANLNPKAWDSFRRQRDEDLVNIRPDHGVTGRPGRIVLAATRAASE